MEGEAIKKHPIKGCLLKNKSYKTAFLLPFQRMEAEHSEVMFSWASLICCEVKKRAGSPMLCSLPSLGGQKSASRRQRANGGRGNKKASNKRMLAEK